MHKQRLVLLSSIVLAALMVSLVGATAVFAQEPPPEAESPQGRGMRGRGGFGRGMFGTARGGQWTVFDAAAEALGLTPEELFAELHGGKSLDEVAEARGVDIEAVQEATKTARTEAMRQSIEQAVEDGNMTQEQADWMLEGLEQGYGPMGRSFGRGCGPRMGLDTDAEDA